MFRRGEKIDRLGFQGCERGSRSSSGYLTTEIHYKSKAVQKSTSIVNKGTCGIAGYINEFCDSTALSTGSENIVMKSTTWRIHNHYDMVIVFELAPNISITFCSICFQQICHYFLSRSTDELAVRDSIGHSIQLRILDSRCFDIDTNQLLIRIHTRSYIFHPIRKTETNGSCSTTYIQ